jgi:inorganic pyrophosphatase
MQMIGTRRSFLPWHFAQERQYSMPNFLNLPPFTEDGDVHVVVETPRGSRAKFAYDPKLESFALSKSLLTGLTYPHDWGFVPSTKADDGDPLDIMVIHDAATFPGLVVTCRVIGVLQIEQKSKKKSERNDRLFAVPLNSHSEQALHDVDDLTKPIREELEKFFMATDELEDKKLKIIGWKGPKVAVRCHQGQREIFHKGRQINRFRRRWRLFFDAPVGHPTPRTPVRSSSTVSC